MIQTLSSQALYAMSDANLGLLLEAMRRRVDELKRSMEDVSDRSDSQSLQMIDELLTTSRN
jgi:hypothetical protein